MIDWLIDWLIDWFKAFVGIAIILANFLSVLQLVRSSESWSAGISESVFSVLLHELNIVSNSKKSRIIEWFFILTLLALALATSTTRLSHSLTAKYTKTMKIQLLLLIYSVWRHLLSGKSLFLHYKHYHHALKPNINLFTSSYYLSAQDILFIKKKLRMEHPVHEADCSYIRPADLCLLFRWPMYHLPYALRGWDKMTLVCLVKRTS